jgi:chemotaxis protein MotB
MALRKRGSSDSGLNIWPGYVDALSTLLMVIIFVLLVFVLAQAFLSVALNGRDQALDKLNRQIAELSDMLSLERGRTAELRLSLAQADRDLQAAAGARDQLSQKLAALQADQDRLTADRDALRTDRDRLTARLADAALQTQAAQSRAEDLTTQLAEASKQTDAARQELQAGKATLEARVADLARLSEQIRALTALRDELEKQARDAAARAVTETQAHEAAVAQAAEEKRLGDSARAELAVVSHQLDELRAQLAALQKALDVAETAGRDKDVQIANLGSQLNAALARKVEELQRYRSEFFGKLRAVLANRPGIQVVGDRFVFQSEVLFPVGSAELTTAGVDQILKLSQTLKSVSTEIPGNIAWILRVDGHADHQPIEKGRWGSNWELSAGRAITVVKLLIADGIAPNRLAATGFGDNQPLDPADTPEAYAKNRRIEIRLTDR